MRKLGGLAALLLAFASPSALAASEGDFAFCDGHGAPGKKYSGMQKGAWIWAQGNISGQPAEAERRIEACDRALADPALIDAYWLHRAVLLQAKAIHQIDAKHFAHALATLDQADAVGDLRGSTSFDGSVLIANRALRAIAYYGLDNKEAAHKALASISADRPWSGSLRDISLMVRLAFEPDYETHKAGLVERAVIDPGRLHALFWLSLSRGAFEDAAVYSRQLSFDIPRNRSGWTLSSQYHGPYESLRRRASTAGGTAYALAAIGNVEASAHAYREGLDEIAEATIPPAPDYRGRPPGKAEMREYDLRKLAGGEARALLEDWGRAIALRREAANLTLAQLKTWPNRPRREALIVAFDFFRQIKATDLKEAALLNDVSNGLSNVQDEMRRKALAVGIPALIRQLPRPNEVGQVPQMRGEGGNFFRTDMSGFAVREADDPELVNVRFGDLTAGAALVEEAAFLAAANHVASLGKDGFVVEAMQMIRRRTTIVGMYGGSGGPVASGHEVRLLIRPVAIGALPAGSEQWRWRIIKVADVKAALAGKFPVVR